MKRILVALLLTLGISGVAVGGSYNYIAPEQVKKRIEAGISDIIVDIQVEDEFAQHHIPGSLATHAYPVKSDSDKAKIDVAIKKFQQTGNQVVIVCPRGAGGAKRCYDYMNAQGVPAEKLVILEKGIAGWPYEELTESSPQ